MPTSCTPKCSQTLKWLENFVVGGQTAQLSLSYSLAGFPDTKCSEQTRTLEYLPGAINLLETNAHALTILNTVATRSYLTNCPLFSYGRV